MAYNNTYYLHFVTDLRRIVFCVEHGDTDGAKTFLGHAHKIYQEHLRQIMDGESKELRFDDTWLEVYNSPFPAAVTDQKKYCEKLLTLSSMIFLRSTQNMPVLPHQAKMAQKAPAASPAR